MQTECGAGRSNSGVNCRTLAASTARHPAWPRRLGAALKATAASGTASAKTAGMTSGHGAAGQKAAKAGVIGCLAVLAGIQFVRPAIPQPPATADLAAPAAVKQILRDSCYDCHSNQTRLAWFDRIVPAYWLVASDVKAARRVLNFSEIGRLSAGEQKGLLYEAVNQIQLGGMPLAGYTRLHPGAAVSDAQLAVLKSYLNPPAPETAAPAGDLAADDAQYQKWLREDGSAHAVSPAPNGIEFPRGYQNWKAISTTDRFDNRTMRVILGNDTAIRAIAAGHINPWPDGTTFAKIAWLARDDGRGQVHPGAFVQVEFMIRDAARYAATKGWGWARWRGAGLTPYGRDASFTKECIGCHAPVRHLDYVFTLPLRGQP